MLRALLVDDESPARDRMRGLLADHEDVEVVGEAGDGELALRRIAELAPDLVFLDIEMPGCSGMEVAAALEPPRPQIVFCTAFDEYAVEAFERHAVGYLLKPVNRARLARTLDEARRHCEERDSTRRELARATEAQARLLPRATPALATLRVAGACRPAREIGGDYYDFIPLGEGRLVLVVADVSGKGLDAGLLGAALQARIQALAGRHRSRLERLAADVDRWLGRSTADNRFATCFLGSYDDHRRELSYVNAGHVPGLVLRAESGACEALGEGGPVLGLLAQATYRSGRVRLEPGDVLLVASDGVLEAESREGDELGPSGLAALAREHAALEPAELCGRLLDEVERRQREGTPRADDMTLVLARAV